MRNNIICELEEKDLPQYKKILSEVFNNNISLEEIKCLYEEAKLNSNIHVLGYYVDDVLVGAVTLDILTAISGKKATLWTLGVLNNYRRLGIATKLILHAENMAKNEGVKGIWLFSRPHRESAHMMYRKLKYDENYAKGFVKFL